MLRLAASFFLLFATFLPATAQPLPPAGATSLDPGFHGRVVYFGNHSGRVIRRIGAGKPTGLCPKQGGGCAVPVGGSLRIELVFRDDIVTGHYQGTGGLPDGVLIGRRVGDSCRLFDKGDGSVWSGRCDGAGFSGGVKSVANAPSQTDIGFETVGVQTIDYEFIRRRWQEDVDRARRFDGLIARAYGNGPIADRLDAALELDGPRHYGGYEPGSLSGVRKGKGGVSGSFRLAKGDGASVRAGLSGNDIACLEYGDTPGQCRPFVRPSPPPMPPAQPDYAGEAGPSPIDDNGAPPRQ